MTDTLISDGQNSQVAEGQQSATETTQGQPAGVEQGAIEQQVTDSKATEGQGAEEGKAEGEQAKPAGAPEKYEFQAPEGREFDPEVLAEYSDVARELNMSQESAQKMLDRIAPVLAAKQEKAIEHARNEWSEGSKADKEFGGEKLQENLSVAKKALDAFGTPELKTLLNESGLGNHPEIIRVFYRAGKAISEDNFVGGKAAPAKGADTASILYPNQK